MATYSDNSLSTGPEITIFPYLESKHLGFLRGDALCISGFVNVFSAFELWSQVLKLLMTPSPEAVTSMVSHLPLEKEGSVTINGDHFMFLICG